MQFYPMCIHMNIITNKMQNFPLTIKELPHATMLLSYLPHPCPLVTPSLFSTCLILSFWGCYINRITLHVTLWNYFCSLNTMPLRSILVLHLSEVWCSLLLSRIPPGECTRFYSSIRYWRTLGLFPPFYSARSCVSSCGNVFSFLWDKCSEVQLLGQIGSACLVL